MIRGVICLIYLLLTIFYHHIDKYLSGSVFVILTLLVPIAFITIVVYFIIGLIQIINNIKKLTFRFCIPTIICFLTLLYTIFSPYRLDSEMLESEVDIRACYEGTQNQAYIKFRRDKTFELNWTGAFGYNEWWTGYWNKIGDILVLKYDGEMIKQLGDTVLIDNGYLKPIGNSVDTIKFKRPMFYLGYCRHEN